MQWFIWLMLEEPLLNNLFFGHYKNDIKKAT